ncbi:DUF2971 domain-containing protein [Oceanobacillus damuensis]|uniref:DUF2971 domain-containing protein n=1 Tax=Oceanobacillus damuensis TaxID=937928 RepID=UPI00083388E0|nr:DUF2971 domain-containing protein [Oceanobacillus damuensis]
MDNEKTRTYLTRKQEFEELYQYNNEYNIYNNKMDLSVGIWRYMNFSRFVNLLDSNSLFFSKPSSFRDPYEGSYSEVDIKRIIGEPDSFVPNIKSDYDDKRQQLMKKSKLLLDLVGVSCWHLNNNESAAMWDLYLRSGDGIAIKSNVSNLIRSITSDDVFYGQVQYIDYTKEITSNNTYESLFYKRSSFSHENEFRLICFESIEEPYFKNYGTLQKCDINLLIDEIYVSPLAPRWFTDTVRSVSDKYAINKPIIQSSLYNSPKTFF